MHAHMVCISPWPCTPAVVRLLNARHSNLIKPCFGARIRLCAPTEISTANLVGFGIYGEASSVTDATVPLYRITSVTSSQGRTRLSMARSNTVQTTLLEWWSVWCYAPLTRQDECIPELGSAATTLHRLARLVPDHVPDAEGDKGAP